MSPAREISDMNVVMKRFLSLLVVLGPATAHADKTFNSGKGATWDCAKDDDVTINTSGGTYTFKGACKDINVNGASLTISIESVEDITVNGTKNKVTIGAVDDINVNGNDNTVTYGAALEAGKKPSVSSLGSGNTIKAGAAPAPSTTAATTPTTTTSTAPNATVLDCSKTKNVSITKGKGTYRVTGTCDKVSVAGGSNTIAIDAVKNLAITGSKNTISVGKADKIAAMGSGNTVTYGSGLTVATPKTASMGKGNTITGDGTGATTGITSGTATTTTTTAAAAGAGVIDCNKGASHSITDNNGSYHFTGKCELISVDGNSNTVKIDSAKGVSINGNKNTVDVTAVGALAATGNDNTARWKKGLTTAKPKLSNVGNGNKVAQAK